MKKPNDLWYAEENTTKKGLDEKLHFRGSELFSFTELNQNVQSDSFNSPPCQTFLFISLDLSSSLL